VILKREDAFQVLREQPQIAKRMGLSEEILINIALNDKLRADGFNFTVRVENKKGA
jgi:hypothetical protein